MKTCAPTPTFEPPLGGTPGDADLTRQLTRIRQMLDLAPQHRVLAALHQTLACATAQDHTEAMVECHRLLARVHEADRPRRAIAHLQEALDLLQGARDNKPFSSCALPDDHLPRVAPADPHWS